MSTQTDKIREAQDALGSIYGLSQQLEREGTVAQWWIEAHTEATIKATNALAALSELEAQPSQTEDLEAMRDELELLGSMIRAERATPTRASHECTDEQLERCYALRDRLPLIQPKEGLSDEEIEVELDSFLDNGSTDGLSQYGKQLEFAKRLHDKGLLSPSVDVRGLTADNERLRALVQVLLEALDQEAFGYGQVNELGDYVLTVNAFKSAKKEGFTPTN